MSIFSETNEVKDEIRSELKALQEYIFDTYKTTNDLIDVLNKLQDIDVEI